MTSHTKKSLLNQTAFARFSLKTKKREWGNPLLIKEMWSTVWTNSLSSNKKVIHYTSIITSNTIKEDQKKSHRFTRRLEWRCGSVINESTDEHTYITFTIQNWAGVCFISPNDAHFLAHCRSCLLWRSMKTSSRLNLLV